MTNFALDACGNYSFELFNPHPRDLWLQKRLDHDRLCDENYFNKGVRIHEEYLRYTSETQRLENINFLRNRLLDRMPEDLIPISIMIPSMLNLPDTIRHMAKFIEDKTSLDSTGIALGILAMTSAACSGKVVISVMDSYSQPFILQMIGISESGTRKSELKNIVCSPIAEWTSLVNEGVCNDGKHNSKKLKYIKSFFQTRFKKGLSGLLENTDQIVTPEDIELIKEYVHAHVESEELALADYEPIVEKKIILDNATPAGLIQAADENGESINIVSAEGDVVGKLLNKNDDRLIKLVMRGYDHEAYSYHKYRKTYRFIRPSVSMMLLMQNDIAMKLYRSEYLNDIGFTNRIIPWIFSHITYRSIDKFEPMPDILQKYNAKIKYLLDRFYTQNRNSGFCTVNIDKHLKNTVKDYLDDMQKHASRMNYGRGWFAKAGARAIRLACAIHFWNSDTPCDKPINIDELRVGAELVNIISRHVDFIYSPQGMAAIKPAKKIMEFINRIDAPARYTILREGITSTVIQERTGLSKESVYHALALLSACNQVTLYDEGKRNVTVILRN